jgi:hypothetical protein
LAAQGAIAISMTAEAKELSLLVATSKQPELVGERSGAAPCPDALPLTLRYYADGTGGGWARFTSDPTQRWQPAPSAGTAAPPKQDKK